MPITYPEGGMPGLVLKQRTPRAIDTFKVQLVPLRAAPIAKISGPEDVARLVREMEDYDRESAKLIHLDTKNQVMGVETISIGSLNASIVHPRETVKGAILNNSANVIFLHNHPSGICEPSTEDLQISRTLKDAFALVGIELLDSVIVGKGCHYSLRETGFFTGRTEKFTEVSESITDMPKAERMRIARGIAATTGPQQEPGKFITLDEISKLPAEERKKYLQMISAGQIKSSVVREPAREPVGEKRHEIIPEMEIIDTFKGARWERGYFQCWYTAALLKDREGKYWIDPDYPGDDPRDLQSIGADPKYKEFEDINDSALTPEYTTYVIAGYSPNYHFIEKRAFFSVSYMGRGYFPENVRETAKRIFRDHGVRADAVEHSYYFVRAGHFDKLKEELETAGIEVEELSRKDVGAYWDQEGRAL